MVAAAIASIALALFAPAIFGGQVPTFRDFTNIFLPFKLHAARAIAGGTLPLWTREPAFGVPFLANYQSGVLYPPSAIVYLWPNALGVGLYLAAHFWIAGLGMDALLRRRGLPSRARLFGALVWMLGGVMISIAPWGHLAVACWIPLSIAAAEDFVTDARALRFAWLVTLLTLQALGGAPETFVQGTVLVGAGAILARSPASGAKWRAVALVGLAGVLALALAAPQLLPTIEYVSQTARSQGLGPSLALDQSLDPKSFLTLLVPHRLDAGVVAPIFEPDVPLFWSIYVGIVPLVLCLIGALRRCGRLWAFVLIASLVLALGTNTPVGRALFALAPRLLGAFRYPQKLLVTSHLATAVLAALGFAWMEQHAAKLRAGLDRILGCALIAMTVFDLWDVHAPALLYTDLDRLLASPPAELTKQGPDARLFHYQKTASGNLERWMPRFWIGQDLRARELELWAELSSNSSLAYGLGYLNGNDGLSFHRPAVFALYGTLEHLSLDRQLHLLRVLGVRFLTGEQPLESADLELVEAPGRSRAWVYRLRDPSPPVYLARRTRRASSFEEAARAMAQADFQPGEDAVLMNAADAGDPAVASGVISVVSSGADALRIEIDAAGSALLVVEDSYFPGWQARVDGRVAPILLANAIGRAVAVSAGRHRVDMRYDPASFRWGVRIALGALALLVIGLARWPRRAGGPRHAFRSR